MAKITVNKTTKGSKSNQQKMATIQVSYQFIPKYRGKNSILCYQ